MVFVAWATRQACVRIMGKPKTKAHTTMLDKLNRLTESHGALYAGKGLITGVIALVLGCLCFLAVLAFHFPQYLTAPELRQSYDVDVMRALLFWSMVLDLLGSTLLFAFLDYLFGTAVKADRAWPVEYGVRGDYVPAGFWKQLVFPFSSKNRPGL